MNPAQSIRAYLELFDESAGADVETRRRAYDELTNRYYDLVTDFYRFGWGESFHFAPRRERETFADSIARLERFLAGELGLRPGMTALDLGCGIGGPMREIARHSGSTVIGLNKHGYQLQKAGNAIEREGLGMLCRVLRADFMQIPLRPASIDAAYEIEATAHAPDKIEVYSEILRVLRPGGVFAGTEWCLTAAFEPDDAAHAAIKQGIEVGNGLPDIPTAAQVDDALRAAGFVILAARDLALDSDPDWPWYRALQGRDFSLTSIPRTPVGRRATTWASRLLEMLRVAPEGTTAVGALLGSAADQLVAGGVEGIFTPLYYFKARRPD